MRFFLKVFILSVIIFSCKSKEREISGTWVEITDYYRPEILVFDQNSVVSSLYGFKDDYEIWGNRLTFVLFDTKWKYEITHDTLKLFDFRNDSLIYQFLRNDSLKIRSLITDLYNVQLPEAKNMKLSRRGYDKDLIIVLSDIDNDSVPELHINGDKFVLDSLLYSKIIRLSKENFYAPINLLFVDRYVKVRHLKILEKELQKAGLRRVCYVICHENELHEASITFPFIQFNYPDSLKDQLPPAPPPPEIKNGVYCHLGKDNILLDNAVVQFDSLKNRMFHEFSNGNNPELVICFDQELNYEQYIHYFIKIQHIYYQARDDYALKKYNCKNFTQGCQNYNAEAIKIRNEVIELYQMNILLK